MSASEDIQKELQKFDDLRIKRTKWRPTCQELLDDTFVVILRALAEILKALAISDPQDRVRAMGQLVPCPNVDKIEKAPKEESNG